MAAKKGRKPGRDAEGLTPRQARFVELYLMEPGNAARSYVDAGYSPRGAAQSASALLRNPNIQAALARRRAKTAAACQVSREQLVRRLLDISDLDLSTLVSEDGSLKSVHEWPEAVRRSVQGLEVVEQRGDDGGIIRKVKLGDRGQNLERIAKLLGFMVEKRQDTNTDLATVADALKDRYTPDQLMTVLDRLLGRERQPA